MAKHRSPAYPQADLPTIVGLLERLYPDATRHPLGVETVAEEWGYKGVSSAAPYIAATKQFGLMQETREGEDRMLQMTERGVDICDPDANEHARMAARRHAATAPTIFGEMWDRWGSDLPPESEIRRYLTRERDFNPKHVSRVASNYLATLEYATLTGNDAVGDAEFEENDGESSVDSPNNGSGPEAAATHVRVGSFVQWTSQGQHQFPEPLRVIRIVDAPGGEQFAYLEGFETNGAVPVSQLTVEEKPEATFTDLFDTSSFFASLKSKGESKADKGPEVRFPLDDGNEIVIRLKEKVSEDEFERITQLLALSKKSLVEASAD